LKIFIQQTLRHVDPTKITFLYFLVGTLFVGFKHELISFFPSNSFLPKSTNLYIDLAILIATTGLLHILLISFKQYDEAKVRNNKQFLKNKLTYLGWVFVILLMIPLVNLGIYRHQVPNIELNTYDNLQTIASIKVQQLKSWLDYRLADGDILAADKQFANAVMQYMHTPNKSHANVIQSRFDALMEAYHYESVTLIGADGSGLLHVGNNSDFNTRVNGDLIRTVNQLKKTFHSDFFIDDKNQLNLQIVAPVFGKTSNPVAYVLFKKWF
jgi:hypothetical protein